MNIHDVEKWINDTRKANGGVISPEFAMEILSKTNHLAHIKKVLSNIKEKCDTPEKIAPYREFILSCVDGREMSADALKMLHELAKECGCGDELKSINNKKPKFYGKFDCDNVAIVKSREELEELEGENLTVYFDAGKVELRGCDLSKMKALKFREGADVDLWNAKNLPKDLDVSMCSNVDLGCCDLRGLNLKFREGAEVKLLGGVNLPKDLDVSMCSKVDFIGCDLEGLNLKFREGADVKLLGCINLPKDLDVSMCSKVDLGRCDLEGLNLKFREGAEVYLDEAKNLPKDLDVSMCSKADLSFCNLREIKELKFKDGAIVNLRGAENLPEDLDISMCDEVDFRQCMLIGIKKLKFKEGAKVNFMYARYLPKELDVSMCNWVKFSACDLSGVEKIKFKNIKQKNDFMDGAAGFKGKVVYSIFDLEDKFKRIFNKDKE